MKVGEKWMMWYNGAEYDAPIWVQEQIGVAILECENLF